MQSISVIRADFSLIKAKVLISLSSKRLNAVIPWTKAFSDRF